MKRGQVRRQGEGQVRRRGELLIDPGTELVKNDNVH